MCQKPETVEQEPTKPIKPTLGRKIIEILKKAKAIFKSMMGTPSHNPLDLNHYG